jgi:hypothetical protein
MKYKSAALFCPFRIKYTESRSGSAQILMEVRRRYLKKSLNYSIQDLFASVVKWVLWTGSNHNIAALIDGTTIAYSQATNKISPVGVD